MQVIDLEARHEPLYFVCLEDWSDEMKEAGDHKAHWYGLMRDRGLRVKLALDDGGEVGGMIQYLPIEESFVDGEELYFIPCIWVHGHEEGRGDFRKRGMGTALLEAAEGDVRARGAKGMAAWGLAIPVWMRASWFKKHGYRRADRKGLQALVWKPFVEDAKPPRWMLPKREPEKVAGRVVVTSCLSGWCPAYNISHERARRAAASFGDEVLFETIDTRDRRTLAEWGISDQIFIDGVPVGAGPPPTREKLTKLIAKRARRL